MNLPPYKMAKVDSLIPYARNSRTHSDSQVAQIAASINEFGFTNPVLVDAEHGIIAGHGRVLAARMLGMSEVPVIELAHLTDAQKRAYVIADNKLALNAGWDFEALKIEFEELSAAGFDLSLTGFGESEMASAMGLVEEQEAAQSLSAGLQYRVVIDCESEQHQALLIQQLEDEGLSCRPLIS